MPKKFLQIAIDGPVAAGKGTVSRLVAERLGILYVDTGAMYRMTALLALQKKVDPADAAAVCQLLKTAKMDLQHPDEDQQDGRLITALLNQTDVSWQIRTEEVSAASSVVAQHPCVRKLLVAKQQRIAADQDVIMEGRDITHKVLPTADLKIFMTADEIVRAQRRHLQEQTKGKDVGFEEVYTELINRDERDTNRATDPLMIVDDAWVIDTSDMDLEEVVDVIAAKAQVIKESK